MTDFNHLSDKDFLNTWNLIFTTFTKSFSCENLSFVVLKTKCCCVGSDENLVVFNGITRHGEKFKTVHHCSMSKTKYLNASQVSPCLSFHYCLFCNLCFAYLLLDTYCVHTLLCNRFPFFDSSRNSRHGVTALCDKPMRLNITTWYTNHVCTFITLGTAVYQS